MSLWRWWKYLAGIAGSTLLAALLAWLADHYVTATPPSNGTQVSVVPVTSASTDNGASMEGDVSDQNDADSTGDVHIRSGDGAYYDFQLVGEFIALKSKTDNFELQVRQTPWHASSRTVSTNIAAAMNVNGDRVGVYVRRQNLLYVNGTPTPLSSQIALPKGGRIVSNGYFVSVVWHDGTTIKVTLNGDFMDVLADLPPSRAGTVAGLFGNFDGNPLDDLTARDGERMVTWDKARARPAPIEIKGVLYGRFGSSWRISQAESLFDYGPGESTKTYTDLNFPYTIVSLDELGATTRQQAEAQCRQAGVTDARFLADCILDVAATGDSAFIQSAARAQGDIKMTVGFECGDQPEGGVTLHRI